MKPLDFIVKYLAEKREITAENVAKKLSISRQAAHRHLSTLVKEGKILKVGRTKGSYYIPNSNSAITKKMGKEYVIRNLLTNHNLQEDVILDKIEKETLVFANLKQNIRQIVAYAFTEMLNNAIDHSNSKKILYVISRTPSQVSFKIKDWGIGVFKNIKNKFHLSSEMESIQELIKGKSTTAPKEHTGEGIFFTSKVADRFSLESCGNVLIFDHVLEDVFIREKKQFQGTIVGFTLGTDSGRKLDDTFKEYSDESFIFDKSKFSVKLFAKETEYISRSQARRLLTNLEKFHKIVLDFSGVKTIGQGFADQIFRVFKQEHPEIEIETINCCDAVNMMISHVST